MPTNFCINFPTDVIFQPYEVTNSVFMRAVRRRAGFSAKARIQQSYITRLITGLLASSQGYEHPGFELDRNAPERRSGSFLNRNGVPVHFFLNSERKSDSCWCVHTIVLPSV